MTLSSKQQMKLKFVYNIKLAEKYNNTIYNMII